MSVPLVSVIMPTYNRKHFLVEAVESVFSQSFKDYELIVVDDGSTDNTKAELDSHGMAERLRYIPVSHSGKPGKVRNIGIREASGKYIALLDSDDLWLPDKLEIQVALLENESNNAPICHTRERWIRNGKVVSQAGQKHKREGYIFTDALKKCIIGPSTVLLKKEILNEVGCFNEKLEIAEDYELWLRVTARYPVSYINKELVIKRGGHRDQLSWKYGQIEVFRIAALRGVLENEQSSGWSGEQLAMAYLELSKKCLIYANGCFKRGKVAEGERYLGLHRLYDSMAVKY